jgi:hypothetical protein
MLFLLCSYCWLHASVCQYETRVRTTERPIIRNIATCGARVLLFPCGLKCRFIFPVALRALTVQTNSFARRASVCVTSRMTWSNPLANPGVTARAVMNRLAVVVLRPLSSRFLVLSPTTTAITTPRLKAAMTTPLRSTTSEISADARAHTNSS